MITHTSQTTQCTTQLPSWYTNIAPVEPILNQFVFLCFFFFLKAAKLSWINSAAGKLHPSKMWKHMGWLLWNDWKAWIPVAYKAFAILSLMKSRSAHYTGVTCENLRQMIRKDKGCFILRPLQSYSVTFWHLVYVWMMMFFLPFKSSFFIRKSSVFFFSGWLYNTILWCCFLWTAGFKKSQQANRAIYVWNGNLMNILLWKRTNNCVKLRPQTAVLLLPWKLVCLL